VALQHIHIIGVCGTFMGGVARLATEMGYRVSGSDKAFYPPMSEQLAEIGLEIFEGFAASNLDSRPDLVIVGNAVSRGNPEVEALLDAGLPYTSGAQWLGDVVLRGRHVLAVAGTHGKTTTASLLAHILESAGLAPGYLIGGVPGNFSVSARLGKEPYFVVEADEYDTAFFDKRSKFVHYRPSTLILNNLEFDHADIFADLNAIETQFHHLMRCVPSAGRVVFNADSESISRVLARGCWSATTGFGRDGDWRLNDTLQLSGPSLSPTPPAGGASNGWARRVVSHSTMISRTTPLRSPQPCKLCAIGTPSRGCWSRSSCAPTACVLGSTRPVCPKHCRLPILSCTTRLTIHPVRMRWLGLIQK